MNRESERIPLRLPRGGFKIGQFDRWGNVGFYVFLRGVKGE